MICLACIHTGFLYNSPSIAHNRALTCLGIPKAVPDKSEATKHYIISSQQLHKSRPRLVAASLGLLSKAGITHAIVVVATIQINIVIN